MSKFTSPLNNVKIASPCSQNWDEMIGTDRKRFCGECNLNVYNLSGMSEQEAENLLINSEGRLCVRFYRRADGSVLTKDCPVGWRALKQRLSKTATAAASMLFAALGSIGLANYLTKSSETRVIGTISPRYEEPMTGAIAFDEDNSNVEVKGKPIAIMGNVAVRPRDEMGEMGKMRVVPYKPVQNKTNRR